MNRSPSHSLGAFFVFRRAAGALRGPRRGRRIAAVDDVDQLRIGRDEAANVTVGPRGHATRPGRAQKERSCSMPQHYAVLRHGFDIHRNPDRLGPAVRREVLPALNGSGDPPPGWKGTSLWLISWEGFMKTHHVICGWFTVSQLGKRHGVVAQHYVSGDDGEMFPRGLGPARHARLVPQVRRGQPPVPRRRADRRRRIRRRDR